MMRVFLTGFMGAGKTTVGQLLGVRLALPFVDLDESIEESDGREIATIFESGGESEFRRLEHEMLERLCEMPDAVVATGGGTMTSDANRRLLRESGVTVWLHPPFETIARRIGSGGRKERPMYIDESRAFELYRKRLPIYGQCDLQVEVAPDEDAAAVAARIDLLLGERA